MSNDNVKMKARDTIAAKLAECFITIGTRRYNFMNMIDMEAKVDKTKAKVPRLGAIMVGHKSCGMEGTFSGTAHYNQSVMRQCLADYKNTGEDVYFEMQITMTTVRQVPSVRQLYFMIATRMAECWQNLMQTENTWMRKLRVHLKISRFQNPLQNLRDF